MPEKFKKGSIVPRRLGAAITKDRKAQHCITFGCDVEVDHKRFTALSEGPLLFLRQAKRRMNNGTYKKTHLSITGVTLFSKPPAPGVTTTPPTLTPSG